MSYRRWIASLAAGLVTLSLLSPASPAVAATALPKATKSCSGVWVVVDRGNGQVTTRCATKYSTGLAALRSAGFTLTTEGKGAESYLCAVNGFPSNCKAKWAEWKYWSYWTAKVSADGSWGKWTYSSNGPNKSKPKVGQVEGWRYLGEGGDAVAPSITPPKLYRKAPTPTISGTAKVGKTLTAKVGSWSGNPKFSYQWYRSGKKITKATTTHYRLVKADGGKKITVKVTGSRSGWETLTKTSKSTAKVKK